MAQTFKRTKSLNSEKSKNEEYRVDGSIMTLDKSDTMKTHNHDQLTF